MRWTIATSAALLALWLTYAAWPFFGLYRLADAVQTRDLATLNERIDFPALRGSLTTQIVRTYLRLTGKAGRPGSLLEQFAVGIGASVADPLVAKLVSPDVLIDLLQNGRPSGVLSESVQSIAGLETGALGNVWRAYVNSELGIARFFISVPVDKPLADSFRLRLCLTDWIWKLCGVELPEQLQVRLAEEIVKSQQR